jgi:hypothetical protein
MLASSFFYVFSATDQALVEHLSAVPLVTRAHQSWEFVDQCAFAQVSSSVWVLCVVFKLRTMQLHLHVIKEEEMNITSRFSRLESLERRLLFAGDVQVFLDSSGNLIVTGDASANGIQLDQFGEFVIQGIDAGGSPTSINGVENGIASFPVTGKGDIRILLGDGNDIIETGTRSDSVDPPDDLVIDTGAGDDSVLTIGDTNIGGDLLVTTGAGNDSVFIVTTEIAGDLTLSTGADNDTIEIYGSVVGDDLQVTTAAGADSVSIGVFNGPAGRVLGRVTVNGSTVISLGDGDDVLELVDSNFARTFRADGGRGSDTLIDFDNFPNDFVRRPQLRNFEQQVHS